MDRENNIDSFSSTSDNGQGEHGATMLEYMLLASIIAFVCIVGVAFIGKELSVTFSVVGSSLEASN